MIESIEAASVEELKKGYAERGDAYLCLGCGRKVQKGVIYPVDDVLYEAQRYIRVHLEQEHGSAFNLLIGQDKSVTGLSDLQRSLLQSFHRGDSDEASRKRLGIGSASTIRNHRFSLKEKERQARVFLAIMELVKAAGKPSAIRAPDMEDGPFHLTGVEVEEALKKFFPDGLQGRIIRFPTREKQRYILIRTLAERFDVGRTYTEKEVNAVLGDAWADFSMLRRYLVIYKFLGRRDDGSEYWRNQSVPREERIMDRKAELKLMARETPIRAGIFQIKNNANGKVFVDSTRNLKTMNRQQFQLELGANRNKALQAEWNEYGKSAFSMDILEQVEVTDETVSDLTTTLKNMKTKWLDQLKPYGDRGYHGEAYQSP